MQRKYFNVFAILVIFAMVLGACAQPIPVAPEAQAPATSGEAAAPSGGAAAAGEATRGGVWTRILQSDASNLNPILNNDTASGEVSAMLYTAGLMGVDLDSGAILCDEFSMCESFDVSDDGLVYTFHLRDNLKWNDGETIDADDYIYTYNAIASPNVDSAAAYFWNGIESIEAPDPLTIVVTYESIVCDALRNLAGTALLPSHFFAPDFSDIMTSPENEAPTLTDGPFIFQSWERDDNVILTSNPDYVHGAPYMDGMIYRIVPDPGARLAMLESGEAQVLAIQANQVAAVEANPNLTRYTWQDDGYTYMGMNFADPTDPQDGRDADGNIIPQTPHPILSDNAVRQAIAYAVDYDSIIRDIYFDQGYKQVANISPAITWAYNNDIEPYNYDPDRANALLDEAGWVDSNGDGVREKDGVVMNLELITNAGNSIRENLGVYVQNALQDIGVNVNFQAIDFGTLLVRLDSQDFDMFIIGWTNTGTDPADYALFHSNQDVVGSGNNAISWYSEEYETLSDAGLSVPGCAPEDRAQYYKDIQQVWHDAVPYVVFTGTQGNIAYSSDWAGLDPRPWSASAQVPIYWNVNEFYQLSE